MRDPLFEARTRAQRYWYRDGLEEMTLGLLSVLMSVWMLALSEAVWSVPISLIYILLLLLAAIFVPRIKTTIRERITYPRSGYVDERGGSWLKGRLARALLLATAALVFAGAAVLAFRCAGNANLALARAAVHWAPALVGIAVCAISLYVCMRQGLVRFLVVGVVASILGVAVSIEYPPTLATAIFMAGVGCAWLCSGGVALWNYVRKTVPHSADET